MFKLNIYLRFVLMAVLTIGGILMSVLMGFWYGFPFWLAGILLCVGYVLTGTVQSAAELMQQQRIEEAENRLKLTWKPNWLLGPMRGYYFMVRATIAMHRSNYDEAEQYLLKAEQMNLTTQDEKASVQLQLANIQAHRKKWQAAKLRLRNAKQYEITQPEIKEQIRQFEKAMQNTGQLRHINQGPARGGMHRGGKRRRPRTR